MENKRMDYDLALEQHVGQFGKYQIFCFVLLGFVEITSAIYNMGYVFILATPEHWCRTPELQNINLTTDQIKAISIPYDGHSFERCYRYKRNYTHMFKDEFNMSDVFVNASLGLKETCPYGWEYDKCVYKNSIVTQVKMLLI